MAKGDVIKIRRADLPKVTDYGDNDFLNRTYAQYDDDPDVRYYLAGDDTDKLRRSARAMLALAEAAERREKAAAIARRVVWLRFLKDTAGYVYDSPERNKMFLQMAEALAAKGLEPPK